MAYIHSFSLLTVTKCHKTLQFGAHIKQAFCKGIKQDKVCSRQCSSCKPTSPRTSLPRPFHPPNSVLQAASYSLQDSYILDQSHFFLIGISTWDAKMLGSMSSSVESRGQFALWQQPTSTGQKEGSTNNKSTRKKA